jgi:Fic family protein
MNAPPTGHWIQQLEGYRAFIPAPLPPEPALPMTPEFLRLLSQADQALGRLDGAARLLPNPNLFVATYVRHEAVLSSQIEGTQSTLEDILSYEATGGEAHPTSDLEEVVNYVGAMNHGLRRLDTLPLSLRMLREVHEVLMQGVRGHDKHPGDFRTSQNWIGPAGCTLATASFVPPPPHALMDCLSDLERFLHDTTLPDLIAVGLAHAQFETIHPFLDGNGRVGRLLIALMFCERKILERPILYLSVYLKQHRSEYYERLGAIRSEGDWLGWLTFFLRGVREVAQSAIDTAQKIIELRESLRTKPKQSSARRLVDLLFEHPVTQTKQVSELLDVSFPTANSALDELVQLGVLRETTGQQRYRRFRFDPYLNLFSAPRLMDESAAETGE